MTDEQKQYEQRQSEAMKLAYRVVGIQSNGVQAIATTIENALYRERIRVFEETREAAAKVTEESSIHSSRAHDHIATAKAAEWIRAMKEPQ